MSRQGDAISRPAKSTDYTVVLGSRDAEKGWRDLFATKRNALSDAWTRLTVEPLRDDPTCHELKGELSTVTRAGQTHKQRQLELPGGARLWFYVEVDSRKVTVLRAYTAHPNQTK